MFDPELNKHLTDEEISIEISSEKNGLVKDKIFTAVNKVAFVKEIKSGLGAEIKRNPRGVTIIKKPWYVKFKIWLTKIFTKF